MSRLKRLSDEKMVEGFEVDETSIPSSQCNTCIAAKFAMRPFPSESQHQCKIPGELTHSDTWGPERVASVNGAYYHVSFTDDYTH